MPLHVSQTWNVALLQVCRHRVNDHKQELNKWGAPLLGLAKSIYYLFWPVICWSCYKETKGVKSVDGETSFTATAIVCTWFWKKQRWITTLLAMPCIFFYYNLHIWQLRKLQHNHRYLVPSTAQECHLNDARQTSCDHVHQDSECKKWKDIVIQDPWISRELSSYYRFTQWFGPTLTATEPLFSKSGDLERVGHLIWVKIQIYVKIIWQSTSVA